MIWLLRLYPRAWRRRYSDEVATLLASEPHTFRLWLDLIAGVIDARLNPQLLPASSPSGGPKAMSTILRSCVSSGFSPVERKRSTVWLIIVSLGLVLLAVVLQLMFDQTVLSQTVLYSSYPMALILSSRYTYLKPYSRAARTIILITALAAMFGFFLAVIFLANRL